MHLNPIKNLLAFFMLISTALIAIAQDGPTTTTLAELKTNSPVTTPTSAEIMRSRIAKAKASLVVKNYRAAIYELENIRGETNDETVHRVINVLLMHAYLEQSDYKKAQSFLKEIAKDRLRPDDYFAIASQVINGARTQLSRYQTMGISVSDPILPEEAKNDLDGMRETLELVITQTREIGSKKETASTAAAVLEESGKARGNLARDAYDSKRWQDQVADAREQIIKPRSKVINAVGLPPQPELTLVAMNIEDPEEKIEEKTEVPDKPELKKDESSKVSDEPAAPVATEEDTVRLKPVAEKIPAKVEVTQKPSDLAEKSLTAEEKRISPTDRKTRVISSAPKDPDSGTKTDADQPNVKSTDQVASEKKAEDPVKNAVADGKAAETADGSPLTIGSLIGFATKTVNPIYPTQARTMRMTGTVTVEVIVDEEGRVTKVENASGPALLKRAAQDAIRRWEFTPFVRDGQPVKAAGYVSFNFNL